MNKERRKELDRALQLLDQIEPLREELHSILEATSQEEREYHNNMPENMQSGDRGQAADQAASALEGALEKVTELYLGEIQTLIEEAQASG